MPCAIPFPAEIARAINDGSIGDRLYLEEAWLPKTLCDDLFDLGWTEERCDAPDDYTTWVVKMVSPDQTREVLVTFCDVYLAPEVHVETFRRNPNERR